MFSPLNPENHAIMYQNNNAYLSDYDTYHSSPRLRNQRRVTFADEYDSPYLDYTYVEPNHQRSHSQTRSVILDQSLDTYNREQDMNLPNRRYSVTKNRNLKSQNKYLDAELHRLRKIEAGFSRKGKNIEEKTYHNTYINKSNKDMVYELEKAKNNYGKEKNNNLELNKELARLRKLNELQGKEFNKIKREQMNQKESNEKLIRNSTTQISQIRSKYQAKISSLEQEIGLLRNKNDDLKIKLNSDIERHRAMDEEQFSKKIEMYERELRNAKNAYEDHAQRSRMLNNRVKELREENSLLIKEKNQETHKMAQERNRLHYVKEENNRLKQELESVQRHSQSIVNEKAKYESEIERQRTEINKLVNDNEMLNSKLQQLQFESEYKQTQVRASGQSKLQEHEKLIELYKSQLDEKAIELRNLRSVNEQLKNEAHNIKLTLSQQEAKLRTNASLSTQKEDDELRNLKIHIEETETDNAFLKEELSNLRNLLEQSRVKQDTPVERVVYKPTDSQINYSNNPFEQRVIYSSYYPTDTLNTYTRIEPTTNTTYKSHRPY